MKVLHELLYNVMNDIYGPDWETARRPMAYLPRRPPRAAAGGGAGGRVGGADVLAAAVERPAGVVGPAAGAPVLDKV